MMTVLAPIIVFASGTLGDTIHSRNRFGPYTRPVVAVTQPDTTLQTNHRDKFRDVVQRWGGLLTKAQRDGWATYAANVPVPARQGGHHFITGQQMYVRCNAIRPDIPQFRINEAPVIFNHGGFTSPTIETILITNQIRVNVPGLDDWKFNIRSMMIVLVSDGQSAGTNFFAGPFRLAGNILGNAIGPPVFSQRFTDPWSPLTPGPRWARVRVSLADGRLSPPRIIKFDPLP